MARRQRSRTEWTLGPDRRPHVGGSRPEDMADTIQDLLGADIDFPALPRDVVPENVQALRRITAGQRGLCLIYSELEHSTGGEARFAVRLLKRDCDSRL